MLVNEERVFTIAIKYVPCLALKLPGLVPRMFSKIVLEYINTTLIPVSSWNTIMTTLTQLDLVYLSSVMKASLSDTDVDAFWIDYEMKSQIS